MGEVVVGKSATSPRRVPVSLGSRAVERRVEPGLDAECAGCGERMKFSARKRQTQVICNVYVEAMWNRVEHFHPECYERMGRPYGPAEFGQIAKFA